MGHEGEWIRGEWAHPAWYGEVAGAPQTAWLAWDEETAGDEADDDDWPDDEALDDECQDGECQDGEWPDGEWPDGGWPDGGWPDGGWLDGDPAAALGWPMGPGARTGPGVGYGKGWGHGGFPGFPGWIAVAVAMVAATAGVATGFFLVRGAPAATSVGRATPSAPTPASGRGVGPQTLPGLPGLPGSGNGGGQLRMLITGRVLAVSATSITIGGTGPAVTAAVTGATKITGSARGIGGVKVGDEVAAQITGTSSHLVTTTLRDPAE